MVDLRTLATDIAGSGKTTVEKTQMLITWMINNFDWPFTDYKTRTVEELIENRAGNCREQALVLRTLLNELGIKTRWVSEINIHPYSEGRQERASQLVETKGLSASVFGLRHNDHSWLEVFDAESNSWVPADPSMGIFGVEQWVQQRMDIHRVVTHRIPGVRDMIVPFAVFTLDEGRTPIENRSEFYLIDQFYHYCNAEFKNEIVWKNWISVVQSIYPHAAAAFKGDENLHHFTDDIHKLSEAYVALWKNNRNQFLNL